MPPPTTAIYLNSQTPVAPPGNQNITFQSDGGQPSQSVTAFPQAATSTLMGVGMPDNETLQVVNGVWSVISPGGGTGGGTTVTGLVLTPVHPSGARDGSNTQFTLPAPPVAGTFGIAFLNGVQLEVLGASAQYAVQGTQLTMALPPQSTDVLTYYYYQGTPNSETGGGGSVNPVGATGISAWAMNEGSGLVLHDTAGGNNATLTTGAVTWQTNSGFPGTTPLWNGTGNAAAGSFPATDFDGTAPFSLAAWVQTTDQDELTLMSTANASAGTYKGWWMQKQSHHALGSGNVAFFLSNNYPSNCIALVAGHPTTSLDDGALHFVVITYDGSRTAAGCCLYVDGVLASNSGVLDSLTASTASGLPVRFGASNDGTDEYSGVLAFAEIWGGVLTSAQVSAFYAAGPQLN